ncbi:hypothetical protein CLAFUW4_12938 [Fulvia fulva]|uniref:F-box domain-containing protein n=1 Tax=Passalora fulva TaxID=5499 RepID=A0A9Q8UV85_PASFU|nr:uncharacterized protein CLAFUR5_12803 [Fulvia fulva]KAK4611646.1 hypothetical protein CLAFUR4_12942 [Fulvia fulva]KAK4613206.1 hypothetical protein CLAFUR0_12948 [Fulvia fulva]UJO23711.1 hypothetical protein CLAFUR5_12803 [Fulvia fulva]WPV21066.1 hypothetical protein CLAFUW4_12938 [Fulvia fulva]WPV35864.1 hypothetical protein CLAFUW7_12945 [Fulvia fulva]
MAAAAQVFAIPELFEAILLQLPLPDLLLSQSVNITFRDTIKGSVRLQRALFFRTTQPASSSAIQAPHKGSINHLLLQLSTSKNGHDLLHPQSKLNLGRWSEFQPLHDAIWFGDELLELATSHTASSITPSWLDMHLRQASMPLTIV